MVESTQGYKLVLTGHSLGAAVAALVTMMLKKTGAMARLPSRAVSKMERLLPTSVMSVLEKSFFPTTVGVASSEIMCWGYGCAPCVNRTLAEQTPYIHNVVLQVLPLYLLQWPSLLIYFKSLKRSTDCS